jgi:hypothetical protein
MAAPPFSAALPSSERCSCLDITPPLRAPDRGPQGLGDRPEVDVVAKDAVAVRQAADALDVAAGRRGAHAKVLVRGQVAVEHALRLGAPGAAEGVPAAAEHGQKVALPRPVRRRVVRRRAEAHVAAVALAVEVLPVLRVEQKKQKTKSTGG